MMNLFCGTFKPTIKTISSGGGQDRRRPKMAATATGKYLNSYTRTGGNDSVNLEAFTPDATASLTNFQALTNMTGAGSIGIEINGVGYRIPLLTDA